MNYGVFGVKSVIGYKNSGLLLGLGAVPGGVLGYEIGAQYSYDWIFFNAGYGVSGIIEHEGEKPEAVNSASIIMGGMFSILKIRKGIKTYDDPGWYDHPKGTVSYKVGEVEKKKFEPKNMIIQMDTSKGSQMEHKGSMMDQKGSMHEHKRSH